MTTKFIFCILFLTLFACSSKTTVDNSSKQILRDTTNADDALVIRTDFSNDVTWNNTCDKIKRPSKDYGFVAYVKFLSDNKLRSLDKEQVITNLPKNYNQLFVFIYDSISSSHKDNIILCVDLYGPSHRAFRVKPKDIWIIENNLSIANAEFDDFARDVDSNNIFRGLH